MRLMPLDPGRIRDAFGGLVATVTSDRIMIEAAKEWFRKDSTTVIGEIATIVKKNGIDRVICESNNQGHPIIDMLRRLHHIYPVPVNTTKELKDKKKLKSVNSMGKNVTVEWVEWANREGIILMPRKPWSQGIRRLDAQMSRYIRKTTETGTKYGAAEDDDHDDLVSCLLLLSHYARLKLLRLGYRNAGAAPASAGYPTAHDDKSTELDATYKVVQEMRQRMRRHFPAVPEDDIKVNIS